MKPIYITIFYRIPGFTVATARLSMMWSKPAPGRLIVERLLSAHVKHEIYMNLATDLI